jgi:hypothetical protein
MFVFLGEVIHKFDLIAQLLDKQVYSSKEKRQIFVVVACILVLAVIDAILGAVLRNRSRSVTVPVPTLAPVTAKKEQYYRLFAGAAGNELVFQAGTPHQLAADWIINTDPMHLPPRSDHIIQRYLLTLFYYQMSQNGKSPWKSCNPPTGSQNDTCVFINHLNIVFTNQVDDPEILQNGAEVDNITFYPETVDLESYRWLSGEHECLWAGISCDFYNRLRVIELCKSSFFAELAGICDDLTSPLLVRINNCSCSKPHGNIAFRGRRHVSSTIFLCAI